MSIRRGNRFAGLSRGRIAERGQRNKTEARYEQTLFADPGVARWWFEPFTLRLSHPPIGQPSKYTPDFMILMKDGTTFIDDVKGAGPVDPASIVRLKAAAELFPLWIFRVAKERPRVGGFVLTEL